MLAGVENTEALRVPLSGAGVAEVRAVYDLRPRARRRANRPAPAGRRRCGSAAPSAVRTFGELDHRFAYTTALAALCALGLAVLLQATAPGRTPGP